MNQRQLFEKFLYENPLAVSITNLPNEKPEGITAIHLADVEIIESIMKI